MAFEFFKKKPEAVNYGRGGSDWVDIEKRRAQTREELIKGKTSSIIDEKTGKGDISEENALAATLVQNYERTGGLSVKEGDSKSQAMEIISGGKSVDIEATEADMRLQEEAFSSALRGFREDVDYIRKSVADMHAMGDERLKQLKLQEIKEQSEIVQNQIMKQIDAITDPNKKGDLANLEDELNAITKPL